MCRHLLALLRGDAAVRIEEEGNFAKLLEAFVTEGIGVVLTVIIFSKQRIESHPFLAFVIGAGSQDLNSLPFCCVWY